LRAVRCRPLSTDTGSATDVLGISFEDDALAPVRVTGTVTDGAQ